MRWTARCSTERPRGWPKCTCVREPTKCVGATIVAAHAGEIISELTLAIAAGIGLGRIAGVIHPYPTQAEAIKKIADAYNRTRLTPSRKRLLAGARLATLTTRDGLLRGACASGACASCAILAFALVPTAQNLSSRS